MGPNDKERHKLTRGAIGVAVVAVALAFSSATNRSTNAIALTNDVSSLVEEPTALAVAIDERIAGSIEQCMEQQGFPFELRPTDLEVRLEPQTEGYGIAPRLRRPPLDDPNLEILADLGDAELPNYETVLYGQPLREADEAIAPGGCIEEPQAIVAELIPLLEALDREVARLEQQIKGTAEYESARRQWSACMATSGFAFESPADAEDRARTAFDDAIEEADSRGEVLSDEELQKLAQTESEIATADAGCRADTIDPVLEEALTKPLLVPGELFDQLKTVLE